MESETIGSFERLQALFTPPDETAAGVPFGNPPGLPTFEEARVVAFGIRFDDTATFGKGAERGPEAMRHVAARQVETFMVDTRVDFYEAVPLFDLGDLRLKETLTKEEQGLLYEGTDGERVRARTKLERVLRQFDVLREVTRFVRAQGKVPLMLGGEHTLTYWPLVALADEKPVVLHFDAHRDAKAAYLDVKMCHTTPMRHALQDSKLAAKDFVQIGIRQTDLEEQQFAERSGITTFYPRDVKERLPEVLRWISGKTKNRNVYVTCDIDALDIPYVPCTGTPEPFGLTPDEVAAIFGAIDGSAELIGADMMEVAARGEDFREATTAVQLLLRLLVRLRK